MRMLPLHPETHERLVTHLGRALYRLVSVRPSRSFPAALERATGRLGKLGIGSSTHLTHSGGLSHRSRNSTKLRALAAMTMARGSLHNHRRDVGGQPIREWEGLEGGGRRVAGTIFQART